MPDEKAATGVASAEEMRSWSFQTAINAAPAPVVTFILIGLNVLAFLARVVAEPGSLMHPTTQQLIAWGADFGPLTLEGQWWRVVSACFLHLSIIHIGMNMFILLQVGILTEKLFGNVRFFVLYMLAGVGGSIAGLWVHPLVVSAGASGAVFGVYGALLGFLLIQRHVVPGAKAWAIAKSALLFIAYNIIYSLASTEIDMAAHVGGLLTGFAAGCLLARPITARGQQHHPARAISVAVCGAVAAWASMASLSARHTPSQDLTAQIVAGNSVTVGKGDRVIYSGLATRSDAQALALALIKANYFRSANIVVLLSKDGGGTTVSFLTTEMDSTKPTDGSQPLPDFGKRLVPYPWDDPRFLGAAQTLGVTIAPTVGGPPIKVAILDRNGTVKKVLQIDAHQLNVGTNGSIWYSGWATQQDAEALGDALEKNKFFQEPGRRVLLSKGNDGFTMSFMVREGAWDDARSDAGFQVLGRRLAKSLPGGAIKIRLMDENLQSRKELAVQ